MSTYEILPVGASASKRDSKIILWHRFGDSIQDIKSSCSWDLHELGNVNEHAADLFRIAAGAYVADRLTARPSIFTRDITVITHVQNKNAWSSQQLKELESLLTWLTGDNWNIILRQTRQIAPPVTLGLELQHLDEVTLLSGGLDSFCGAIDRINDGKSRLFVGHTDGTAAVQRAQNTMQDFLHADFPDTTYAYSTIFLKNGHKKLESSTRSRSLLFMSMAAAVASASGCNSVVVPENGFTSINLPLNIARGGALSTRSTHPYTFERMNNILTGLGLPIEIINPYQLLTKGEFVALASAKYGAEFISQLAKTVSCGKLDGTYYRGGNPNLGCGYCFPCIVRRASIKAAGIEDPTQYLSTTLQGDELNKLQKNRIHDVEAVKEIIIKGVSEDDLISCGPWPSTCDLDLNFEMFKRGLVELEEFQSELY